MERIDGLSDLPDSILHHILSFLDTGCSVRTSVLSRRWRSVWKYVPAVNFDRSLFRYRQGFEWYMEQVLSLRSDLTSVIRVTLNFRDKRRKDVLDRLMKYSASHGVQELSIHAPNLTRPGVFGSVCACYQSLKALELKRAVIEKNDVGLFSRLQLLESLTLTHCNLAFGDAARDAFANFPRLESLKLFRCFSLDEISMNVELIVTGPKLLNLEIVRPHFDSLEVVAPMLRSFTLKLSSTNCRLKEVSKTDLPSLIRANIDLFNYMDELEQCANLFKALHNVQALSLEVDTFELLIQFCNLVKHQPSPFKRMKSLNLKCSEGSTDVPDEVFRYFLGGSPYEEDEGFTV